MTHPGDPSNKRRGRRSGGSRVWTGCITCRIRRIKCDEGKPNCNRCTSTGRACDGYALAIRQVEGAQQKTIGQPTKYMTLPRSLPHSITGTETERNFFSACRRATESGVALHICSSTSFWTRLAPQLSHEYEAVRHAVVAVGAAYHLYKVADVAAIPCSTKERIEMFILEQYNRSIYRLQKDMEQQIYANDTTIVLTCCLAYIYLESLRLNYSAAIRHLNNGIRIIESTVDVGSLSSRMTVVRRHKQCNTVLSDSDLWDTVLEFRNCELCMHCFSAEVPMKLGSRLCGQGQFHDTMSSKGFASLAEAHEARVEMASEVMSRDWQWRDLKHQPEFWENKSVQEELSWLQAKAQAIRMNLLAFISSEASPSRGTWEYYSICMDMLHITSISVVIELMPVPPERHATVTGTADFQNKVIGKMLQYGEEMHTVHTSLGWSPPDLSLETAIIGPMYWVYVYSTQSQTKKRAMKILQETKHREGPWDPKQTLTTLIADSIRHTDALRKWGGVSNCYA